MSKVLQEINNELAALEQAFQKDLAATNNHGLVTKYNTILHLRQTHAHFAAKRPNTSRIPKSKIPNNDTVNHSQNGDQDSRPAFNLADTVRGIIKELNGEKFTFTDIWEPLSKRHTQDVTEDKRGSLSATLSNLVNRTELVKVGITDKGNAQYQAREGGGLV